MGSDLYMEERSFQPRPPRVSWVDTKTLLVETDVFYHGYREFYRGPVTKEVQQILNNMGVKIPEYEPPKPHDTVFAVFHQDVDYHSHPNFPKAVFESNEEAVEFAKAQKGYGYLTDWFVREVSLYRKEES